MGYGKGRFWHKFYKFPKFNYVTKTLTLKPKIGYPFLIFKYKKSVFNHVALHNIGLGNWLRYYYDENAIVSISGTDEELEIMVNELDNYKLNGIEFNFTCPNVCNIMTSIPKTKHISYLKLNCFSNIDKYDISDIKAIRLNSKPCLFGGGSGEYAQKDNWNFIKKYINDIPISGCSFVTLDDIKRLEDFGCKDIGIGSFILIEPKLVESLKEIK
jgi:hypothetical protein